MVRYRPNSTCARIERVLAALPDDPGPAIDAVRADPAGLIEEAYGQGLLGVLFIGLPPDARPAELRRRFIRQQLANEGLEAALDEIATALDGAGLRALVMKGTSLGRRLYPELGARLSTDIDLLVPPAQLEATAAALAPLGYRLEHEGVQLAGLRRTYHQVHLLRPEGPVIDLHFRLHVGFGQAVEPGRFWERRVPLDDSGRPLDRMHTDDEFLYLAIHAAGHRFEQLSWLYDLKLYLRKYVVDVGRLRDGAEHFAVRAALGVTLGLLRDRLGTRVPPVYEPPGPQASMALLLSSPYGPNVRGLSRLRSLAYTTALADSPSWAARALVKKTVHAVTRDGLKLWAGLG